MHKTTKKQERTVYQCNAVPRLQYDNQVESKLNTKNKTSDTYDVQQYCCVPFKQKTKQNKRYYCCCTRTAVLTAAHIYQVNNRTPWSQDLPTYRGLETSPTGKITNTADSSTSQRSGGTKQYRTNSSSAALALLLHYNKVSYCMHYTLTAAASNH